MVTALKVHGVDISHHQAGRIDWVALKRAGVQWMYHKSTEGASLKDARYDGRRAEAKAFDMPFGAYHFARPSGGDAKAEAQFFIKTASPQPGDLRPALDLETREFVVGGELVRWADDFCDEVERLTGVVPVVYTPYILSQKLESKAIFWVPRYNNSNTPPTRRYDIFQFSNGVFGVPNSIAGLGHVDLNHSLVSLDKLLIPKEETKPPTFSRGGRVEHALDDLGKAKGKGERGSLIQQAVDALKSIKPKSR